MQQASYGSGRKPQLKRKRIYNQEINFGIVFDNYQGVTNLSRRRIYIMILMIDKLLEALNDLVEGLKEKLNPKPELQPIPVRSGNNNHRRGN